MGSNAGIRRFEFKGEKSSKFWEISVSGNCFTVRYGKIGTDGQTQDKEFADDATAQKQAQKLIAEKVGKGYLEVIAATMPAGQPEKGRKAEKPQKPANAPKPADVRQGKEASEKEGITDLVEAILAGDSDLVAGIIDRGFNPNTRFGFGCQYGISPLHLAAKAAYLGISNDAFLKVVPMLFEATEKKVWSFGRLMVVGDQEEKLLRIVSILLDQGADPLAINGEGLTPLEALLKDSLGSISWGKYLFARLHATLVPPSGSAQTEHGELLRVVRKISHERLGNGWCNLIDSAYEIELDYLQNFFNGPDVAKVFSESEMKWFRLAASMAFLVAYEESGAEPTHSSIGKELFQNKKTIRNGWKRACAERDADVFSSEPFEALEDFCIEYCRRQPLTSTPLTSIFEATLSDTPANIHPELLDELSSQATYAWLNVMATMTEDFQVIERLIKNEDAPGRDALGRNPHLEAKYIEALARNGVDRSLASNSAVAANKLNSWAKDEDPEVRKGVAENPTTTMATLVKLSEDPELEVQQAARKEIQKREEGRGADESREGAVFGEDPQTRIRQALISNDLDAFNLSVDEADSPDELDGLLPIVCLMPLSIGRRLMYANHLLEKGAAASGESIAPLIEAFIVALGTTGSEGEVATARDYLLRIIGQGMFLATIPSEVQYKLYEYHRKGRKEASEVLFALIDQAMPIREMSFSRNNKNGRTIVEMAIHHGDAELISRVVNSARKSFDEVAADALSFAIGRKNQVMLDLLLSDGTERYASADAVKKAINEICYPDYGNPKGIEDLQNLIAVYRKLVSDEDLTTLLFEHLCGAVENGYVDLVEELIRSGAPVDHRKGKTTWGDLLGSFFEMNPKDKVFKALVDAGLDLSHPAADRYSADIEKILKRLKRQ